MRDIQQVLERWGAWERDNREDVEWPPVAAGFKGLFPVRTRYAEPCCDDDGIVIAGCMSRLNKNNADLCELLEDYYVAGMTFITLAKKHNCSNSHIGKKLQKAEGVVEGMLMMLDISLEMDPFVERL